MKSRTIRWAASALALILATALAVTLGACSSRLGWGVVLWTSTSGPIPAGSVVPVYIKSNIEKLFVVGVPGGSGKVELPLWQVSLFPSKGKAEEYVKSLGANKSLYMVAMRDGLPIRESATNDSKRVYRLRERQTVKILEKVDGAPVTTGGQLLPGDWYRVLSDDGTMGYVFSFAMSIYDESKEGPPALASDDKAAAGKIDIVFSKSWRPDFFQEMIDDQKVDLDLMSLRFGLFADAVRHQVRVELPAVSQVFNYSSISQTGNAFAFEGTPLKIRIQGERRLLATWTDDADKSVDAPADQTGAGQATAPAGSAPGSEAQGVAGQATLPTPLNAGSEGKATFLVTSVEPKDVIRLETLRRQKMLDFFISRGTTWASDNAGRLTFSRSGRFNWTGKAALPAAFLPETLTDRGEVAFRLYLDPKLEGEWAGSLSLRFDPPENATGADLHPGWVDFLYRFTPQGLAMAPAQLDGSGLVVTSADPRFEPAILSPVSDQ